MSNHMLTITGIYGRLRGYGIDLTATFPDGEEKTVHIDGGDIKALYGANPAKFLEANENNEDVLCELFVSVAGITATA